MSQSRTLLPWLAVLDLDQLSALLRLRPDVLEAPWPRRLDELADRLASPQSMLLAVDRVPAPGIQLLRAIEVWAAIGVRTVTVDEAARLLGATPAEVGLAAAMLSERALAVIGTDGQIRPVVAVGYYGYGLGATIAAILHECTVDQLCQLGRTLGVKFGGRKQQIIDRLVEFYRNPARVRALVDLGPPEAAAMLRDGAWSGPEISVYVHFNVHSRFGHREHGEETAPMWAARRGLLWASYDESPHIPLEVALALRGDGYQLPFTPEPPVVATAPVDLTHLEAEAASAALRLLDRTQTVLDSTISTPISVLKNGSVGMGAVKALAKKLGATAPEVRMSIELCLAAGLLAPAATQTPEKPGRGRNGSAAPASPGLVTTDGGVVWRASSAGERLTTLLRTWWELPSMPLADPKKIKYAPRGACTVVRQMVIGLMAGLSDRGRMGNGLERKAARAAGDSAFAALVAWHAPLLGPELLAETVNAVFSEAALLGLVALDAATDLAQALLSGDPTDVARALMARARTTALLGTDLTAVVTGPADTDLVALLDQVADRESQGTASTWRFSPASVRRAMDAGISAEHLLARLGDIAQSGVPQPLDYLLRDVARRHGEVGVITVGCVVTGTDVALLAELAAHRRLEKLALRSLAPTVLVAAADTETTLSALRSAGYSPVPRTPGGEIVITRIPGPAPVAVPALSHPVDGALVDAGLFATGGHEVYFWGTSEGEQESEHDADPAVHAARLVSAPHGPAAPGREGALRAVLGVRSPALVGVAWGLEAGIPVRVRYRDPVDGLRTLTVSRPELDGDVLDVWCRESSAYERLELARIDPQI